MSQLYEVIESVHGAGTEFQILQYRSIQNSNLYISQKIGNRINQIRVVMNDSKLISELDSFYFLRGQIQIDHKMKNATSKMRKFASSMMKNEGMLKPSYTGTGEVYFKPGLINYLIYRLQEEEIVVDQNMFLCAEATVELHATQNKNLPVAAAKHAEQFTQLGLSGTGVIVLKTPVPSEELLEIKLQDDRFQADQNIVVFRSGSIDFTVESASKSLLTSFTSSDPFLRTYTGTGTLWIAPTQPLYTNQE